MSRLAALALFALLWSCAPEPVETARRVMPQADFVLVDKSDRTMELHRGGQVLLTYFDVALGDAPVGHKRFQGDERTPEGRYTIDYRNPQSSYHLSLHISYPDSADRAYARGLGRSPGGDIFIHGQAQRVRPVAPAGRLDRRLHRAAQFRDRGNLDPGARRDADRDQALGACRTASPEREDTALVRDPFLN